MGIEPLWQVQRQARARARLKRLGTLSMLCQQQRQRREKAEKVTFTSVLSLYGEDTFRRLFRMPLSGFLALVDTLSERGGLRDNRTGRGRRTEITSQFKVAGAIRFLAGASYGEVILLLRCKGWSSVYKMVEAVCEAVCAAYQLPNPFVDPVLSRTARSFAGKAGAHYFPRIAGALDGLLLKIRW